MKKSLSFKALMILLGFVLCALSAGAYDFPDHEHGLYLNYLSDGSVEVTYYDDNYNTYSGYVNIPTEAVRGVLVSTQTYFPITRIGKYAFRRCLSLTGVSIPTSVTSIGESAFWNCSLTSVTIPYSVKTIEYNAFGDCSSLTSVYIGSGVTTIGTYGFDSPLTYVRIYTSTPPTIYNENAFKESTYNNADLIVPDGSYNAYKNATYWSNFKKMRTVSAVAINSTNFPDANFRSALLALYPSGYVSDIALVTELDVHSKGISNLKGIELFTGLKNLVCYNNPLSTLDLSSNTKLVSVDCAPMSSFTGTKLSSLNVSGCINLEELSCYNNNLSSLDVSNCTKLKFLSCFNNKLTILSVGNKSQLYYLNCENNPQLQTLYCHRCALTTLKVSGCTALNYLWCYENADLTTITGLADCTAMSYLDCEDCKISNLSAVNSLPNITELYCRNNKLTSLEITNKSKLTTVRAHTNPSMTIANIYDNSNLTSLDIHGCTALTELNCFSNKLTSLNVTGNTALQELRCYWNDNLKSITGLADCTAMTYLDCEDDAITDLSAVNSLSKLEELYCRNNKLTSLTITNKSKLTTVRAHTNPSMVHARISSNPALSSLDIHNCVSLMDLTCDYNALTSLNVSGNTGMVELDCNKNKLSSLNVSDLTGLDVLDCAYNQLTSLSVSTNTKLTLLSCGNNNLTSLTVSNLTKLENLECADNQLTSLNVSSKTSLWHLACENNKLTSLNVQGCSSLKEMSCENNLLTSLYVQGCSSLKYLSCYLNRITDAGMTTLVNSLPNRSSSTTKGELQVLYNTGENNVCTSAHVKAANAKNWWPSRYNGSSWIEIPASTAGDVNGDGELNLTDVTTLLTLILNEGPSASSYPAGDYNGDGVINLTDVTMLLTYILNS